MTRPGVGNAKGKADTAGPLAPPTGDFETGVADGDHHEVRLWLRLLTCTNLIEREIRNNLRNDFNITLPRFDLLAQLDRAASGAAGGDRETGELTMGELSRRLMVSNGNVTGLIDRLVDEGLVERRPAPGDRRSQLVRLTRPGKTAFDAMIPVHEAWLEKLFAGLSAEEAQALYDLLARLKGSLEDVAERHANKDRKGKRA